jgi:hypothetical protein
VKTFTILRINPYNDGYTYLYLDSNLICQGDVYHDKIEDYIQGYIDGYSRLFDSSEPNQVAVKEVSLYKEEWGCEDFSGEKHLDMTIKKLKYAGFK